jgi:hypothetical protein
VIAVDASKLSPLLPKATLSFLLRASGLADNTPPTSKDNRRVHVQKYEKTRANLAYLIEIVGPHKLVPVVHGLTEDEVTRNCNKIADILSEPLLVCIGGLVPLLRQRSWLGRT